MSEKKVKDLPRLELNNITTGTFLLVQRSGTTNKVSIQTLIDYLVA